MDPVVYALIAALAGVLAVIVVLLLKRQGPPGDRAAAVGHEGAPQPRAAAVMAGGRRAGPRRRMHVQNQQQEEEEEVPEQTDQEGKKLGKKKMQKLQDKAEKRAQREAMEEERQERKAREAMLEEQRKKDEARREAEEAVEQERLEAERKEQERKDHEEYLKMKASFVVEGEGLDQAEPENTESLLQDFIKHIQDTKVIMLEDLAAHFKMKTADAIDRITSLMDESRLSGVMDDRGKFIHVTMDEYSAVAKFIKQRGRVSISELAESSNNLINLRPDIGASDATLVDVKS